MANARIKINSFINHHLGNYKEVLWLVGDGRSGTTWISELLTADRNYREIFEPFHNRHNKHMKAMPTTPYQRINSRNHQFEEIVTQVLEGKYIHRRSESEEISKNQKGLLIKDIFANLFYIWATENNKNIKSIFIMRHPFSVSQSKARLKDAFWGQSPADFLSQKNLYDDFLWPFEDIISRKSDDIFINYVKTWCIVNYVPLMQMREKKRNIVFYEELKNKPETELLKLLSYISLDNIDTRVEKILPRIQLPSRTTWGNKDYNDKVWSSSLTHRQIQQGMEILKEFNLDVIYNLDRQPNPEGLNELWKI